MEQGTGGAASNKKSRQKRYYLENTVHRVNIAYRIVSSAGSCLCYSV